LDKYLTRIFKYPSFWQLALKIVEGQVEKIQRIEGSKKVWNFSTQVVSREIDLSNTSQIAERLRNSAVKKVTLQVKGL